jgi:hypothetical protein
LHIGATRFVAIESYSSKVKRDLLRFNDELYGFDKAQLLVMYYETQYKEVARYNSEVV